jgi:chromosome condensin MukBEF complex kleisin-like MukF subunit
MKEQLLTKAFFLRKSFSELFDEIKCDFIRRFYVNKKTENLDELNSKLNKEFKKEFDTFYEQNEQNRETFIKGEIKRCFTVYKKTMTEILDKVCLEQNRFEETTEESKSKAYEMLNKICGEENELKESYFSKVK